MKFRLLTEQEASDWSGLSVPTLQTWRSRPPKNQEPIPFVKVGGVIRYRSDDLEKWIERHTFRDNEEARLHRDVGKAG